MTKLAKLMREENEAIARLEKAKNASQEAESKLATALEAGRDSLPARRVLREAKRLVAFAEDDLDRVRAQIRELRNQETSTLASTMTTAAARQISDRLASFSINIQE